MWIETIVQEYPQRRKTWNDLGLLQQQQLQPLVADLLPVSESFWRHRERVSSGSGGVSVFHHVISVSEYQKTHYQNPNDISIHSILVLIGRRSMTSYHRTLASTDVTQYWNITALSRSRHLYQWRHSTAIAAISTDSQLSAVENEPNPLSWRQISLSICLSHSHSLCIYIYIYIYITVYNGFNKVYSYHRITLP